MPTPTRVTPGVSGGLRRGRLPASTKWSPPPSPPSRASASVASDKSCLSSNACNGPGVTESRLGRINDSVATIESPDQNEVPSLIQYRPESYRPQTYTPEMRQPPEIRKDPKEEPKPLCVCVWRLWHIKLILCLLAGAALLMQLKTLHLVHSEGHDEVRMHKLADKFWHGCFIGLIGTLSVFAGAAVVGGMVYLCVRGGKSGADKLGELGVDWHWLSTVVAGIAIVLLLMASSTILLRRHCLDEVAADWNPLKAEFQKVEDQQMDLKEQISRLSTDIESIRGAQNEKMLLRSNTGSKTL